VVAQCDGVVNWTVTIIIRRSGGLGHVPTLSLSCGGRGILVKWTLFKVPKGQWLVPGDEVALLLWN